MNESNKLIKANFVSEEWMNLKQSFAKKQFKQQHKSKEYNKNYPDIVIDQFSSSNNFKKEIEKW